MIPFNLHRRIPLIRRPFWQRDQIAAERDALQAQLTVIQQRPSAPSDPADDSAVARFWDEQNKVAKQMPPDSAWWNCGLVIRHINRIVCGEPIDGIHAGFHLLIAQAMDTFPRPRRALSVGCGVATKEMDVLAAGTVDTFDCYDLSAAAVVEGRQIASSRNLSDKMTFHQADVFATDLSAEYDLIYWNNALHHMLDVRASVEWSRDRLRAGGIFAMDDYVGATRFQHSPALVAWGTRLLSGLPEYLRRHWNGVDTIHPFVGVVPPEDLARVDPSECADSGAILPAVRAVFPNAKIVKTGGAAYLVALTHTMQNYRSETELALLNAILLADETAISLFETQYAVAVAKK